MSRLLGPDLTFCRKIAFGKFQFSKRLKSMWETKCNEICTMIVNLLSFIASFGIAVQVCWFSLIHFVL